VGAWLHFEYLCQRGPLFNERYLSYAVGQILTSAYGDRVKGEFPHPILAPLATGPGRRPAIDFVCFGDTYPDIAVAVETKWAGSSHTTVETILWDLIRLEMVASRFGAECLFILAGSSDELTKLFRKLKLRAPGGASVTHILSSGAHLTRGLSMMPTPHYKVPILRKLFLGYQDVPIPRGIVIRGPFKFPKESPANHVQVYVWKVESTMNREEFMPSNIRHYRP
jgi:hypothetical protein